MDNNKTRIVIMGAAGRDFHNFNMSGTDSKAGGQDYLGLFLQAKSVSRKV